MYRRRFRVIRHYWIKAREFQKPSQGVQVTANRQGVGYESLSQITGDELAYRQDAKPRTDTYAADPDNRLLSRGPRFRLGGDSCATGRCLPAACWWNTSEVPAYGRTCRWGSGTTTRYGDLRNYKNATDDGLYRRTMYTI